MEYLSASQYPPIARISIHEYHRVSQYYAVSQYHGRSAVSRSRNMPQYNGGFQYQGVSQPSKFKFRGNGKLIVLPSEILL
ncbi:unnamed protein product, partial [Nesidiocoris tenuis]